MFHWSPDSRAARTRAVLPRSDSARRGAWRRATGTASLGLVLLSTLPLISTSSQAASEKPKAEEAQTAVDYVALAARMIKDGHYDRAEKMLGEVDTRQEGVDLVRFNTLRGIVFLKKQVYQEARDSFQDAVKAGAKEPMLYLQLAQAQYGLKAYQETLDALKKSGKAAQGELRACLMKADSHWQLKQPGQAIAALTAAEEKFPKDHEPSRIKQFYFVELELYQEVVRLGKPQAGKGPSTEKDYVALGAALRQAKQYPNAIDVLESAKLRFPDSEEIMVQLAHTYVGAKRPLIAAMIFEDIARLNADYTLEAAELYKEAGRLDRALSLNARVLDQAKKFKQRLSILLAMERFEMISAMASRLERLGLLKDDDIRYALAYGFFKTGQYTAAENHLKGLRKAELFDAAMQLRSAMAQCQERGWECNP